MDWPYTLPAVIARELTTRILGPVVSFLERGPTVVGREHADAIGGPFVVCANHASHFDVSTMRLALGRRHRRRLAPAAAEDYFFKHGRTRRFLARWLGGFAVSRTGRGADSIERIERLLAAGWNVALFPEGTRSRNGQMASFKPGVGLVAVRTGRPVLPARIRGAYEVLPAGHWRPRRHRVEVRFGPALEAAPGEDPRAFAARLEACVRAL